MKILLIFFHIFILENSLSFGYKFLAVYPFNGKSHQLVLQEVGKSLAAEGHQVDVASFSPLKSPVPNYTDIIHLTDSGEFLVANYDFLVFPATKAKAYKDFVWKTCRILKNPQLQQLIKNNNVMPVYDAVLVHYANGFQCFSALGHLWDIPVVGIVTTWPYPKMVTFVEQPLNLALYPSFMNSYQNQPMNFWDRLHNFVTTHYNTHKFNSVTDDEQNYYIKKYLGPNMPDHNILEKTTTSLMLANTHYSFHGVKPKSPALIEIGGIHIKNDTSVLDKDLKHFIDQSKHGFVYLSFGTLIRIDTFPNEILQRFYEAIRKVSPVRVVVRVPNPEAMPKNWPENTYVHKWLPQQLLLQHPKIRGFVTHGGVHGIQEGLYHAVPMICVPCFADQQMNCDMVQKKNLGLQLDFRTALQEDYDRAFREILTNPVYRESAKSVSAVYRDRPRSPSDEVVYWIEYVIRHGKNVLKSPAAHLEWWQVELLDVYGFIAACVLLSIGAALFILNMIFSRLRKMFKLHFNVSNKKLN